MPATTTSNEYRDDHAGDQDTSDNRPEANEPQPPPAPAAMPAIHGRQRRNHRRKRAYDKTALRALLAACRGDAPAASTARSDNAVGPSARANDESSREGSGLPRRADGVGAGTSRVPEPGGAAESDRQTARADDVAHDRGSRWQGDAYRASCLPRSGLAGAVDTNGSGRDRLRQPLRGWEPDEHRDPVPGNRIASHSRTAA